MKAIEAKKTADQKRAQPWVEDYLEHLRKAIGRAAAAGDYFLQDPLKYVPHKVRREFRADHQQLWAALKFEGFEVTHGKHAWDTVVSWRNATEEEGGEG